MNPENSNKPNSNNPEPTDLKPAVTSSVPPPPPPFNNVTPPPSVPPPNPFNSVPSPPKSSTPPSPPQGSGIQHWLELLFPTHLRTAYQGATPEQLLRLYGWRVAIILLLLFLVLKFAYILFNLLLAVSLICLLVGLLNPESFRPLFGEKTSKATVGWTFGGAVCFCAIVASITEPKREVVTPVGVVQTQAPSAQSDNISTTPTKIPEEQTAQQNDSTLRANIAPSRKQGAVVIPVTEGLWFPDLLQQSDTVTRQRRNLQGPVKEVHKTYIEQGKIKRREEAKYRRDGKLEREVKFAPDRRSEELVIKSVHDYNYDDQGRVSKEQKYRGLPEKGGGSESTTTYTYQDSYLKTKTFSSSDGRFKTRNTLGESGPIERTTTGDESGHTSTERFEYEDGRLAKRIVLDETKAPTVYVYKGNRLVKWGEAQGETTSFEYWDDTHVKSEVRNFAKKGDSQQLSQFVTYFNRRGQEIRAISYDHGGKEAQRWDYRYGYDRRGNWTKRTCVTNGNTVVREINYY